MTARENLLVAVMAVAVITAVTVRMTTGQGTSPAPADYHRGALLSMPEPGREGTYDLRSFDLSALDLSDSLEMLLMADFDARTVWPSADRMPDGFDPDLIMALGQDPGLGIRSLHEQGITGRGIGIGIIDQPLLVDHEEYAGRLMRYEELNIRPDAIAQMHGPAVASIAVGRTVGVAPEADLHFIASRSGTFRQGGGFDRDFTYTAQAIRRVLEINEDLPDDRKIRVISIQVGWSPEQVGFDEVSAAAAEARDAGLLVICSSTRRVHGFHFNGLGRAPLSDPNDFNSWEPGLFWASRFEGTRRALLVPMDSRTTASPTDEDEYVFYRSGGWSWSTPYIAGLYALACQVNPTVTPDRFWDLAMSTGVTREIDRDGETLMLGPIVNPPALIEALRAESPSQTSASVE